jgi:site-specific DNA recombinase
MTGTQARWGVYTRLSEYRPPTPGVPPPADDPEFSPARQERDCRRVVEARGGHVERVYGDVDISGWAQRVQADGSLAPLHRPEFEAALEDLRNGTIEGLACWKIDRLARNRKDFEKLWDLVKTRGIQLVSVHEAFDTSTAHGEFVFSMMVNIAKLESDTLSLRRRSLLEVQAKNGKPHAGGRRAYGFEADGSTIRPKEAAVLRWVVDQLLDGVSLRQACRLLTEQGVTHPSGQPWEPSKLSRVLRRPRVAGQRTHHGVIYPGAWEPIIEPDVQQRVIGILDSRIVGHPGAASLLAGLTVCGAKGCGAPLWIRQKTRRRYGCVAPPVGRGCGGVSVDADWLDQLITRSTVKRLLSKGFAAALQANLAGDERRQQMAIRLEEDKQALTDLTRDRYVHRIVGHPEFLDSKAILEERIGEAERTLERRPEIAVLLDLPRTEAELKRALGGMPTEELRVVIGAALERVLIRPVTTRGRNKLDEGRVDPRWRF